MPLIPALRRQRQTDLCEFKTSLVYKEISRTARTVTQRGRKRKKRKRPAKAKNKAFTYTYEE